MEIRRKVFSLIEDESGEERYYSTTEFVLEDKLFSEKSKKYLSKVWDVEDEDVDEEELKNREKRKKERSDKRVENSHRGLGRSLILGNLGGALGAYTTKDDLVKDYKKGYSEEDISKRAGIRGAKRGALIGAGLGTLGATRGSIVTIPLGAAWGAVGGYLGSKKNARARLGATRGDMTEENDLL